MTARIKILSALIWLTARNAVRGGFDVSAGGRHAAGAAARISRRVDRHRRAIWTGRPNPASGRATKGRIDCAARPRGAIEIQRRDFPGAPDVRRALCLAASSRGRNISPARWAGRRSRFTIRSPSPSRRRTSADWNCTRGSIRSARCIRRPNRPSALESHLPHPSRTGPPLRQPALARPRRTRRARIRLARYSWTWCGATTWMASRSTIIFIPTRKRTRRAHAGFSRRRELAKIRRAQRHEPRRLAAAERESIHPERLSIHQGAETVGEIRHQPVRHLASGIRRSRFKAWTPTQKFTPTRAYGCANGWLDYLSPQLYWPVDSPQQSFPVLLNWWAEQNVKHRHLWPGLNAVQCRQKMETGRNRAANADRRAGNPARAAKFIYHLRNLMENPALADVVRAQYPQPALVPASPWLDSIPPAKPKLSVSESRAGLRFEWANSGAKPAWLWVLQFRTQRCLDDGNSARESNDADVFRFQAGRLSQSAPWIGSEM